MVNISDFFNKNKKKLPTAKSSATNSRTSSSASKAPEIINLDDSDEDDDLEELIQKPPRKRPVSYTHLDVYKRQTSNFFGSALGMETNEINKLEINSLSTDSESLDFFNIANAFVKCSFKIMAS